jgi:serine phosphatase RsbU (regulator of sigma subunit)
VIDPAGGLCFAGAGHPPLFVRRASGVVEEFRSQGTILGVRREMKFAQTELHLAPGEHALFYTDGLFSMKSPTGERLSHCEVAEAFAQIEGGKEALPELIASMQSRTREPVFDDDVAAIALHRTR